MDQHMRRITEWGGVALAAAIGLGVMVREWPRSPPTDNLGPGVPAAVEPFATPRAIPTEGTESFYQQKRAAPVEEMPEPF